MRDDIDALPTAVMASEVEFQTSGMSNPSQLCSDVTALTQGLAGRHKLSDSLTK